MTIVATPQADAKTLADAKYQYETDLAICRDRAIRAMHEAEAALDSLTSLELEVSEMCPGVKVQRDLRLVDAANALTVQVQSFHFGREGSS